MLRKIAAFLFAVALTTTPLFARGGGHGGHGGGGHGGGHARGGRTYGGGHGHTRVRGSGHAKSRSTVHIRKSQPKKSTSHTTNKTRVHVSAYTKKDGTRVGAHDRTTANTTKNDNWSTQGNVNPETGQSGTKPPGGSGH
jgi:hypothetical protein